ncbi:Yqey-like protein [Candidatus Kinetoplastibacterium desouzaii TCC079E]|uniref:Yqey-like protein n=1 Tax=Candidatus Kinetoplastidibacterium desouzai TCC079E TaxID=1208919 RepID=M1L237_9PROT|nr:GatB/YqeY domain-containing protein [Candidatus Kinetoplastibacterium desouzaii]AGF46813.1 Yqey-like protein [Candidatus Kinetoplastibacterium desouzaii TCC079E]
MDSSNIKNNITSYIKEALKQKQTIRLSTLRLLLASIKEKEINKQADLSDVEIISIIQTQIKQRLESIKAFEAANRQEKAEQEREEIIILKELLPNQASIEEILEAIDKTILSIKTDVMDKSLIGKILKELKKNFFGRADMSFISQEVHKRLNIKNN